VGLHSSGAAKQGGIGAAQQGGCTAVGVRSSGGYTAGGLHSRGTAHKGTAQQGDCTAGGGGHSMGGHRCGSAKQHQSNKLEAYLNFQVVVISAIVAFPQVLLVEHHTVHWLPWTLHIAAQEQTES